MPHFELLCVQRALKQLCAAPVLLLSAHALWLERCVRREVRRAACPLPLAPRLLLCARAARTALHSCTMAHLDLGIDGLEPTPAQLSCTGLSEDIAVAPPATEEDIEAIIDSIGRMEMEERETAAAPRGVRMDTSKKMGGALGAKRGSTKREEGVAKSARRALDEQNIRLLREAIIAIGAKAAKRLLKRVVETQRDGGLATADGSRKRTPGGVFFHLLRDEMTPEAYKQLMKNDSKRKKRELEERRKQREKRAREGGTPGGDAKRGRR